MATQRASTSINEIQQHIDQFEKMVVWRLKKFFGQANVQAEKWMPEITTDQGPLSDFVLNHQLTESEWGILMLALLPNIRPHLLDNIIQQHIPKPGNFTQIGGIRGKNFRGFLPTGETALFILADGNLENRQHVQQLFDQDHFFAKKQILYLDAPPKSEPRMSGQLIMAPEFIEQLSTGRVSRPVFGMNFPAQLVETQLAWDDLVLAKDTFDQVGELHKWIEHENKLLHAWGMGRKLKPGYRVLFYGPPGTGKTLTASLLGKYTGKEVYKIDLSMVVSKFIGETEKNLANLFAKAENKGWILFFDEADALFGKRTNVRDAHDKYANQEVSYLLQRVEDYNGLVILASNFKSNMDEAFIRRFQSIVHFPAPRAAERLKLWNNAFPKQITFNKDVQIEEIARKYELTGAEIMNIVQYCCIEALASNSHEICRADILEGIKREFNKEGKIMR